MCPKDKIIEKVDTIHALRDGEVPSIDGLETKQNKIKLMSDSVPHRAQCVVKRDIKQINKHVIKN